MNNSEKKEEGVKIIFMGTPDFAVASLEKLHSMGYNIAAVVTTPDRTKGRGLKLSKSAVKESAEKLGIETLTPSSLKDPLFISKLKEIGADIFIVVAFRMLPKEIWSLPPLGCFNLHASLLPHYPGAAPINWAIIEGEERSGVTTFYIDKDIDTGNILLQESVEITPMDNAGTLHDKLKEIGAQLVIRTVDAIRSGTLTPIPQNSLEIDHSKIKFAPKLTPLSGKIEWDNSSTQIHNLVRGFSPYPGAFSIVSDGDSTMRVKIFETAEVKSRDDIKPGSITTNGKSELIVGCGSGAISILSLQMEGRKRVSIEEFLRGRQGRVSIHFI